MQEHISRRVNKNDSKRLRTQTDKNRSLSLHEYKKKVLTTQWIDVVHRTYD